METKSSNKITYLYSLLSIFVIALHCVGDEIMLGANSIKRIHNVYRIICNMSVPTFFFVSAVLMYKNIEQKKYFEVIKKKMVTLFIPYVIWNVLCLFYLILKSVLLGDGYIEILLEQNILVLIYTIVKNIIFSRYNTILWFIRELMILTVFFPVILRAIKNKYVGTGLAVMFFVINMIIGPTEGYSSFRYWLPVYLLGAIIGYHYGDKFLKTPVLKCKTSYCYVGIMVFLLAVFSSYSDYVLYLFRCVSPFLYWILADLLPIEKKPKWWMNLSFFYFVSQYFVCGVVTSLYIKIVDYGVIQALCAHIILPMAVSLILAVGALILQKLTPNWWKVMVGNRK